MARKPTHPDAIMHLHWLWKEGPALLKGVTSGGAICGAKKLPRQELSSFKDDVTCPKCLASVASIQQPTPVETTERHFKRS